MRAHELLEFFEQNRTHKAPRPNVACLWPLATFELIINLKSAKPLTISESFLLRANEVIAMPPSQ
jgi:hypothetical protein